MKGGNKKQTRGKPQRNLKKDNSLTKSEDTSDRANMLTLVEYRTMEAIQANIIVEIQVVHLDVKKEINETIGTLKSKVANFRGEIN